MTREQIKAISPDLTDEQITAFLNMHHSEMKSAKEGTAAEHQSELDEANAKAAELENKLKEMESNSLTDAEKLENALKEATETKAKYEAASNRLDVEKMFVTAGLAEDSYKDLLDSIVSADKKTSVKTAETIIAVLESQKSSVEAKVKEELMKGNPNPDDHSGGGGEPSPKLSAAEAYVKSRTEARANQVSTTQAALSAYGIGGQNEGSN